MASRKKIVKTIVEGLGGKAPTAFEKDLARATEGAEKKIAAAKAKAAAANAADESFDPEEVATAPKRERLGATSLRHIDPEEALRIAQEERHIKLNPARGEREGLYVGAPYSMRSMEDLARIREAFDADVLAGAGGADWYQRVHPWIKELVGDDPVAQRELAQNLALFSSQANPDTNLGFSIKARNANIMGMAEPGDIIHTGAQADKYREAFETGQPIFEQTQDEAKKTNIYGQHLDPTATNPNTGTNDIWHARAFGYTDPTGRPWDAALSDTQHAWLDAETILAAQRANMQGIGGRRDWTPGQIQAAAWVAKKGRDWAEKRFNKPSLNKETFDPAFAAASPGLNTEAKKALRKELAPEHTDYTQGPITAEQFDVGLGEAAKTYPDYAPKYEFQATGEAVPGKTTGHGPEIARGTQEVRNEYSARPGGDWLTPEERDLIYASQGAYTAKTKPMVGRFGGETNVGQVARPSVSFGFDPETGARVLDPASEQMVRGGEAVRGYFDVQDAAAGSIPIAGEKVGNTRGYELGGIPFNTENMDWLGSRRNTLADIVHYGDDRGLLTNFMDRDPANFGKRPAAELEAEIQQRFPGATVTPVGVQGTYVDYNADYGPEQFQRAWRGGAQPGEDIVQGSDRATQLMLSNLNEAQLKSLDNEAMRAKVLEKYTRDEQLAARGGFTTRPDVQMARKIFATEGFAGLKAAIGKGILPAAAGAVLLQEFAQPSGSQQPANQL